MCRLLEHALAYTDMMSVDVSDDAYWDGNLYAHACSKQMKIFYKKFGFKKFAHS